MKTAVIIPARYASTRFPGKPLQPLLGCGGVSKTLIQRSWEAAITAQGVSHVAVATDDTRIADHATGFGADVIMTSSDCRNGTERCADALAQMDGDYDLVVNLQGDAPLTPAWFVEDLIQAMANTPQADVATPVLRCDAHALNGFLEDRKNGRVGGTTAVFSADNSALYFSKEVIPFTPAPYDGGAETPVFHHVGVYAYRPAALQKYLALPEGALEVLEGLEQLRFLENNIRIHCVEVDGKGRKFWELNNPEDIDRIEKILTELGVE